MGKFDGADGKVVVGSHNSPVRHTMLGGVYYNLVTAKLDSNHILSIFFNALLQVLTALLIELLLTNVKKLYS